MNRTTQVLRNSLYFPSGNETLFGWRHRSPSIELPIVVVICNPLGVEYMSGHRSIRHIADQLATRGIETLRFDYAIAGDSSGGAFERTRISQLVDDICCAASVLRARADKPQIVLLGIGLGATFAALATQSTSIDHLIMWNPTVSGKRFVREQRLLSEVLTEGAVDSTPTTDVGGILLTPELQDELKSIDLAEIDYSNIDSILLVNRKDRKANKKFTDVIQKAESDFGQVDMSGYKEMMDQPTDTIVPFPVIEHIGDWICSRKMSPETTSEPGRNSAIEHELRMTLPAGDHCSEPLVEAAEKFGDSDRLFGIVSVPKDRIENDIPKRAFLFLNCGSEHHAGPHRMYTILARHCASFGALSFRFDIEGIGDSFASGNNEDNNSYSAVALDDIEAAMTFVAEKYGCKEFILSGICAGAYHSFKATASITNHRIVDTNLINPLVFEWNYDDPDDHLKFETHTYRSSVRDPKNWRRLFKGDIDYRRLIRSYSLLGIEFLRRLASKFNRLFTRKAPVGLPRDMQEIAKLGRRMALVLSEGDPGLDIMRLQAARETKIALKNGSLSVHTLNNANHGLSKRHMQDQLIQYFIGKYGKKLFVERRLS